MQRYLVIWNNDPEKTSKEIHMANNLDNLRKNLVQKYKDRRIRMSFGIYTENGFAGTLLVGGGYGPVWQVPRANGLVKIYAVLSRTGKIKG